MNALFLGYLLFFAAAAVACFVGVYQASAVPDRSVRRALQALLLMSGGWAGAYAGVLLAPTAVVAEGFHLLGLVVGALAVGAWLWFCSAYAGRDLHRDPKALQVGLSVLGLVVLTKVTNPWHELYFTATAVERPFPHVALDYHLLYWGSAGLAYALAAVGYFVLYDLFRNVGSGGGALGPLAGAMALPIAFNAVGYASPSLLNISHEPLGVAVFAVGVFYLYGAEFRAVRFAGGEEEPAFVLGRDGALQEYNRSAGALLSKEASREASGGEEMIGRPLQEILPEVWEALTEEEPSIRFGKEPRVRYYQLETGPFGPEKREPGHFLVLKDVTDQKVREEALKEERSALRRMSHVTADSEASFDEKISRLIGLGREYLGLSYGFLAEVSGGEKRIVSASGPSQLAKPEETYPISGAYCGRTFHGEGAVATWHDGSPGSKPPAEWEGPPAEERRFASYIGAKVVADGELYGTFCFGSPEPRAHPFNDRDKAFVELLAHWAGYEIERRQNRRQLQRQNERLEQFSGVLTHDLRNPLNVAQGRLALALEEVEGAEPPEPEGKEGMLTDHLRSASGALERMEQLIADVLALTWSGQDFGAEDLEAIGLRAVAEGCWEQVEAPEATLKVESDLTFQAHAGRLQQLLENLFRNAVEHGSESVTVTVGALQRALQEVSTLEGITSQGGTSEAESPKGFFVEDDGPGIPEEKRDKIFERGYSSEEGTGLGLSIAGGIAEAHGWNVSVAEGQEGGARFEIAGVEGASHSLANRGTGEVGLL